MFSPFGHTTSRNIDYTNNLISQGGGGNVVMQTYNERHVIYLHAFLNLLADDRCTKLVKKNSFGR